jgi:hemoglobin
MAKDQYVSVYDFLGESTLNTLIAAFYRRVATDPILRPLYPDHDMDGAERRLRLFIVQYFGGPTTYTDERGHPRLRMRHAAFVIDPAARNAWVNAMLAALAEAEVAEPAYSIMRRYFEDAATFLINSPEGGAG